MKVTVTALDHEFFTDVELPVEIEAFGNTMGPAHLMWATGAELIRVGARQGSQDGNVHGLNPNYMYALELGNQIEVTDDLLETMGFQRVEEGQED
ncbi:hypothetical protein [Vibrio phage VpV262]|uniref:Uncharacterized protein n=1 Tax=Vibrio phage VpV262 TaxID=2907796 RepID=Q8LT73_9CAUD|nr:hypothetical protein VpV262p29 [Vibrio phage VpV262]AAM28377.1 hypothetical protein [Vibrio phage VpV262]